MIRWKEVLLIGVLTCILLGWGGHRAHAQSDRLDYDKIDLQIRQDLKKFHIPAMAIMVVDQEEVVFAKAYGKGVTLDSPFIIGSMSKSFTGLAIMQLVEAGKINLDAPISQYIDGGPWFIQDQDPDKIRVRDLLNHTSGLTTYQQFGRLKVTDSYGRHVYANANYGLLGLIIEGVSGMSYQAYMDRYIFQPLAMTHSAATLEKSKDNGLIAGYRNYFGIPLKSQVEYPAEIRKGTWTNVPAGYVSASANDLGKYLQMYLQGGKGLVSPTSIKTMFYEGVEVDQGQYFYGVGWQYSEKEGHEKMLWHAGLVENYMSSMFILPDQDRALVVLVNTNDYLVTNNFIQNIINPLLGQDRKEFPLDIYLALHGMIDLLYVILFLLALIPLLSLGKWKRRTKTRLLCGLDLLGHLVLPLILLGLPIYLATPSRVIWLFVRDLWLVLYTSIGLLVLTGLYKLKFILSSRA